jgi:NADPH:quinone reductase-like Zn-dependent oxidoreductase
VTGVCSTNNLEFVRSLGADQVIDYTSADITKTTDRYDLVTQVAGTLRASRLRRLLTPNGTLVQLSGDSPNRWVGPLGRIIGGRLRSVIAAQTITSFTVQPNRDDLELLASLIDSGALRPHLHRTYVLDEVAAALEHVETGRTRGKVAVTLHQTERPVVSTPSEGDLGSGSQRRTS